MKVMTTTVRDSVADAPLVRPSQCPSCHGRDVDTLAKTITLSTSWRCRSCEKTWTIGSLASPVHGRLRIGG